MFGRTPDVFAPVPPDAHGAGSSGGSDFPKERILRGVDVSKIANAHNDVWGDASHIQAPKKGKIDLANIRGDVSQVHGDISKIRGWVTTKEGKQLSGDVSGLEGTVSGICGKVDKEIEVQERPDDDPKKVKVMVTGDATYLRGDVTHIWGPIVKIEVEKIGPREKKETPLILRGDVSKLRKDIKGVYGIADETEGDVSQLEGDITTLRGNVSRIKGTVERTKARIGKKEKKEVLIPKPKPLTGDASRISGDISNIYGLIQKDRLYVKGEDGGPVLSEVVDVRQKDKTKDSQKRNVVDIDSIEIYGDVSKIRGDVSYISGDISNIKGDVSHIRGKILATLKGDVSNIFGDVSHIDGDPTKLRGDVSDICGDVSNIFGDVTDLKGDIPQELHGDITNIRGNIPQISGDISLVIGKVDAISGDVSRIRGDVSRMSGDVSRICGNVSRIYGDISQISGDVSKIEGDVSQISGDVSKIEGDVTHVSGDMTGKEGDVTPPGSKGGGKTWFERTAQNLRRVSHMFFDMDPAQKEPEGWWERMAKKAVSLVGADQSNDYLNNFSLKTDTHETRGAGTSVPTPAPSRSSARPAARARAPKSGGIIERVKEKFKDPALDTETITDFLNHFESKETVRLSDVVLKQTKRNGRRIWGDIRGSGKEMRDVLAQMTDDIADHNIPLRYAPKKYRNHIGSLIVKERFVVPQGYDPSEEEWRILLERRPSEAVLASYLREQKEFTLDGKIISGEEAAEKAGRHLSDAISTRNVSAVPNEIRDDIAKICLMEYHFCPNDYMPSDKELEQAVQTCSSHDQLIHFIRTLPAVPVGFFRRKSGPQLAEDIRAAERFQLYHVIPDTYGIHGAWKMLIERETGIDDIDSYTIQQYVTEEQMTGLIGSVSWIDKQDLKFLLENTHFMFTLPDGTTLRTYEVGKILSKVFSGECPVDDLPEQCGLREKVREMVF